MPRPRPVVFALATIMAIGMAAGMAAPRAAEACRVLDFQFTPSKGLQIVVWLEDKDGNFVDTLFITESTGLRGLGNRPGIMEFNSDFRWPYGRRESIFPVWAHRRGVIYPRIVFQDGYDRDLSHAFTKSSPEAYFCRPLRMDEQTRQRSIDANSCATVAFTDKGRFDGSTRPGDPDGGVSYYPPRRDVTYMAGTDSPDVQMFTQLNDLDAVSRATPPGGALYSQAYSVPSDVPDGDYVAYIEVSKEFDPNSHYNYPSPVLQAYGDYGEAYRGQPSVVWKVPLTLDTTARAAQALDYDGYGDPDGVDGNLRAADGTITTGAEGSGAGRLLVAGGPDGAYRFRVTTTPSDDAQPPGAPVAMEAAVLSPSSARVTFVEPDGQVRGYDVRLSAGQPMTADDFDTAGRALTTDLKPGGSGTLQTLELDDLAPQTHYWVGIRAHDSCLNGGRATIAEVVTPKVEYAEVSACFIATAAFGSPMQADVTLLRAFRDRILRRQALGEIFVETYYTFGPALAGVIRPSDTLRAMTRAALEPVVDRARVLLK